MSDPLNEPKFMTQRERLMTDHCTFILRQHALRHKAAILLNTPEIDEQGYDITIEHDFDYIPVQLKTKTVEAKTAGWKILKKFFLPSHYDQIHLSLTVDGQYLGLHGGGVVVLQEFGRGALTEIAKSVSYYFCDIFYIISVSKGFWISKQFSKDDAVTLLREMRSTADEDRFTLPQKAFLPVISPAAVLDWRLHMARATNHVSICGFNEDALQDDAPPLKIFRMERSSYIPPEHSTDFPSFRTTYDGQ